MALLSVDYVVDLSCTENILEGFWNGIYTGPKSAPEIKQSTQIKARQQNTGNSLAKDKRSFARLQGKGYWYQRHWKAGTSQVRYSDISGTDGRKPVSEDFVWVTSTTQH